MNNENNTYIKLKYGIVELTEAHILSLPEDLCTYIVSNRYPAYINEIVDGNNPREVLAGLVEYDYLYSANAPHDGHSNTIRKHIEDLIVEYIEKRSL
jgi:hypothetical protein